MKSLILLLIAGLLVFSWFRLHHHPLQDAQAPDFILQNEDKVTLRFSQFRGKVLLVNFWATWCPPCAAEIPDLNALYHRHEKDNFLVLGLSMDEEGWPAIHEFEKRIPIDYPVFVNPDDTAADLFHADSLPVSFLIDENGKVLKSFEGNIAFYHDELEGLLLSSFN